MGLVCLGWQRRWRREVGEKVKEMKEGDDREAVQEEREKEIEKIKKLFLVKKKKKKKIKCLFGLCLPCQG